MAGGLDRGRIEGAKSFGTSSAVAISIRELHLKTGQWFRHAASRGPVVVTDHGRRVAALQPFDASVTRRPLPNREAAIRKRSKVPVDSVVYQSELREDR